MGDVCHDCILFDSIAASLGNIQCPKRIVNGGYDVLVSIIIPTLKDDKKFQFIKLYWNVIIFEKLIVSLNILVD